VKSIAHITGEEFSAQKLAKLHGVHVKTVYKWKSNYYSDLELIAGKKSKPSLRFELGLGRIDRLSSPQGEEVSHQTNPNSRVRNLDFPG
jgi:hypothetical protein